MDWVEQEVKQIHSTLLKAWNGIELWKSEAWGGVSFVIFWPDGCRVVHESNEALSLVKGLRAKYSVCHCITQAPLYRRGFALR